MNGYCSHCREFGYVLRYRMWQLGLRYLHPECESRLSSMGMRIEPVTIEDPRQSDAPIRNDRRSVIRFIASLRGVA